MIRRRFFCLIGLAWIAAVVPQLHAQDPPPEPFDSLRVRVVVDSASATVGLALRLPVGAADDPVGLEGRARVFASALERALDQALAPMGARIRVELDRAGTTVRLSANPARWTAIAQRLQAILFGSPLPESLVADVTSARLARLRFEAGAPVRAFQDQRFAVLFEDEPAWGRPSGGTTSSLQALSPADAAVLALGRSVRAHSVVAVVGPVNPRETREVVGQLVHAEQVRSLPRQHRTMAWSVGAEVRVEAPITSTWVAIGLPVAAGTPLWQSELLAHHIRRTLQSDPPRPGMLSPSVEVMDSPGGPVILATFAVVPERAESWAEHVLQTALLARDAPPSDTFFQWERRGFRTVWLAERARPEDRAALLARAAPGSDPLNLPEADQLNREALEATVAALGPARILIFGPDLATPPDA